MLRGLRSFPGGEVRRRVVLEMCRPCPFDIAANISSKPMTVGHKNTFTLFIGGMLMAAVGPNEFN